MMIELNLNYSSCVEHPPQRIFLAIDAYLDLCIYEGDTYDNFAHRPGPSVTTFVPIYDQFADWYIQFF